MKSWYNKSGKGLWGFGVENLQSVRDTEALAAFLDNLQRLDGVPVSYLFCDAELIPPESIRFFYIDEQWVENLIEGALSLGQTTWQDKSHDAWLKSTYASEKKTQRTGFVLRSDLVSGWPSLEIEAYGDEAGSCRLTCLKKERLSEDTLLYIVDGVLKRVSFIEPVEGLHFGFPYREVPLRENGAEGVVDIQKITELSALELAAELLEHPMKFSMKGNIL